MHGATPVWGNVPPIRQRRDHVIDARFITDVALPVDSLIYLNQRWIVLSWTLRNKLTWNSNQSAMEKIALKSRLQKVVYHRRNTPSARVPLLTAPSAGSIYLFAQFPTPARVLLSRGLSGGSSKPPTHCSRQAFEATFDKLQLIRTTLISKMIKTL